MVFLAFKRCHYLASRCFAACSQRQSGSDVGGRKNKDMKDSAFFQELSHKLGEPVEGLRWNFVNEGNTSILYKVVIRSVVLF